MSWSVNLVGKPEAVAAALEEESAKFEGQSKVEFDDAKSHLAALVKENFAKDGSGYNEPVISLEASGHGTSRGGDQLQRTLTVKIQPSYSRIVVGE